MVHFLQTLALVLWGLPVCLVVLAGLAALVSRRFRAWLMRRLV